MSTRHVSQSASAPSREIASRAGLNERYVREWFGAMAMGWMVDRPFDQEPESA